MWSFGWDYYKIQHGDLEIRSGDTPLVPGWGLGQGTHEYTEFHLYSITRSNHVHATNFRTKTVLVHWNPLNDLERRGTKVGDTLPLLQLTVSLMEHNSTPDYMHSVTFTTDRVSFGINSQATIKHFPLLMRRFLTSGLPKTPGP